MNYGISIRVDQLGKLDWVKDIGYVKQSKSDVNYRKSHRLFQHFESSNDRWRPEGGADGATAPGNHPGGHPRDQFL